MPIQSGQITAGTAAVEIPFTSTMPFNLEIKNLDNTDDLFIGNGNVSTTTGLKLDKEERISLTVGPSDKVFVVSAKGTHSVGFVAFSKNS
jgi:2-keto-3-deoxy-6-phosphogluconate aldolase